MCEEHLGFRDDTYSIRVVCFQGEEFMGGVLNGEDGTKIALLLRQVTNRGFMSNNLKKATGKRHQLPR